ESLDSFLLYDSNLFFLDANQIAMENYFRGFEKKSLVGNHMTELIPGIVETGRYDLYKIVLKTGRPLILENIIPNKRFGSKFLRLKAFKCANNLGLIVSDVTELRKKQLELKQHKENLESLLYKRNKEIYDFAKLSSESPFPLAQVSVDKVLYTNKAAQKIFLLKQNEALPDLLQKEIRWVLTNYKSNTFEWKTASYTYFVSLVPIKDTNYVNLYATDITTLKNSEKKFERFYSNVIHELRTPISILQMSMKYLEKKRGQLTSELQNELFNAIYKNTRHINELINDLVTISKLDEINIELHKEDFSVEEMISEIMNSMAPFLQEKKIKILTELDQNIQLNADKKKIRKVLLILIDNAIKYSNENSEILVKALINHIEKIDGLKVKEVLIQVVDHGMGIKDDDLPHLFNRFFRSKAVTGIDGVGLGLSIAKNIIEMHGGNIRASQNADKGATFTILLPNNIKD
ncbi:MAG: ATP-binding protein, partial [Promethearchaeota archaeon]